MVKWREHFSIELWFDDILNWWDDNYSSMQNKKTQLGRAQQCSILLEGNLGDGDIYIYIYSGYFAEIILAFQITRQIQKRGVVSQLRFVYGLSQQAPWNKFSVDPNKQRISTPPIRCSKPPIRLLSHKLTWRPDPAIIRGLEEVECLLVCK